SVIDCSKAISTCSSYDGDDVWEIVKSGDYSGETIPVIAVLTIAATGSEMDPWAVISNPDTKEKICFSGANLLPRAAFENPELTFTLPSYQTACGSFDIFSHVLDDYYFSGENTFELTKQFQEAVMRTVLKYAPVALSTPSNYEARANLMWSSSVALNSMLDGGSDHKAVCHAIEHELSAYYDITHGHGLAIITPRWLEYCLNENTAPEIARLGRNVFGLSAELSIIECAEKTVKELYRFCFETLGLPDKLSDVGIDDKYFTEMAEHACSGSILHSLIDLNSQDIVNIFNMCL
ncbi:MAG: iron-containing alcohol dehydrogenase, partial [Clostridiales bacterium]|nr:iron-containing alcohol dehydrogenase [Clostridiales bacterium]